jgi:hypothetical protein
MQATIVPTGADCRAHRGGIARCGRRLGRRGRASLVSGLDQRGRRRRPAGCASVARSVRLVSHVDGATGWRRCCPGVADVGSTASRRAGLDQRRSPQVDCSPPLGVRALHRSTDGPWARLPRAAQPSAGPYIDVASPPTATAYNRSDSRISAHPAGVGACRCVVAAGRGTVSEHTGEREKCGRSPSTGSGRLRTEAIDSLPQCRRGAAPLPSSASCWFRRERMGRQPSGPRGRCACPDDQVAYVRPDDAPRVNPSAVSWFLQPRDGGLRSATNWSGRFAETVGLQRSPCRPGVSIGRWRPGFAGSDFDAVVDRR